MLKMRRLLLLSYRYAESGAIMIRHRSLVEYLSSIGVHVDIVGKSKCDRLLPSGVTYTQVGRFRDFSIRKIFFIIRLFLSNFYLIRKDGLKRCVQQITEAAYALDSICYLFRKNQYDACMIGVVPWEFYIIVPFIKNKCRTVLDISDPLYKNAFFDKEGHPVNKRMEGKALRSTDKVIVMNEMTINMYVSELMVDRNKVFFLPPATDSTGYHRNQFKDITFNEPIKLIYSGSLYPGYRDLFEVEKALNTINGILLDVVTRRGYNDSDKIHYYEWMPHVKMIETYQKYDFLLFVDNFFGYQSPSKIFELIATNKPILFVYDKRNEYLLHLLNNQKGIIFVENKCNKIKACLEELNKKKQIEVNYTIDLKPYSQEFINEEITKQLFLK